MHERPRTTRLRHVVAACLLVLLTHGLPAAETAPTPPAQPSHGPGSSDHSHARVIARLVKRGARGWWLFTPAAPLPAQAPVVVFCHGWGALNPKPYMAWIQHIVGRGNIVIYPNYQDSLLTRATKFLPNAIAGVRGALADLAAGDAGIRPDLKHVAVVGHSAGGALSAQLAAVAESEGLPTIQAVMPVEPGNGSRGGRRPASIPGVDLRAIPASTLLLVVVGAGDHRVYEKPGLHIYDAAIQVPPANKNVLELRSDFHGSPPLLANHAAPGATLRSRPVHPLLSQNSDFRNAGVVDAMDWYGTWKLFDALSDAAFYNRERDVALGGGPAQLFMGNWSDGVPVRPMRVLR